MSIVEIISSAEDAELMPYNVRLFNDSDLSSSDVSIYCYLHSFKHQGQEEMTANSIAKALGKSANTVSKSINNLVRKGWITRLREISAGGANICTTLSTNLAPLDTPADLYFKYENKVDRKTISPDSALAIFRRDDFECQICGDHKDLQVDHIVPLVKGGEDAPSNMQTLCGTCNATKGARW